MRAIRRREPFQKNASEDVGLHMRYLFGLEAHGGLNPDGSSVGYLEARRKAACGRDYQFRLHQEADTCTGGGPNDCSLRSPLAQVVPKPALARRQSRRLLTQARYLDSRALIRD